MYKSNESLTFAAFMKRLANFLLLFAAILIQYGTQAQEAPANMKNNKAAATDKRKRLLNINVNYDFQQPGADMKERFGNNSALGAGLSYKSKSNWMFGFNWSFMFSPNVRENGVLDSLRNNFGYIIAQNGSYASVTLSERGYHFFFTAAKIFPLTRKNLNSGIMISGGMGFMQHKIRIAVPNNNVPQLSKEHRKGYDRLSNGLALNEFIGYYFMDKKRYISFYVGYNLMQGFTQSRRDWNYDTMTRDTQKRNDFLSGIRFGWVFPIQLGGKDEEYFFR